MVSEYDRAKRMLEKYPTDPDVAYFARKYARREAKKSEAGTEINVVLKDVIDAWRAAGMPDPTVTPLLLRSVGTLIDQHGVEAVARRLVAGIESQSPSWIWRDGQTSLQSVVNNYDAIPTGGVMSPGDLFSGGIPQ